MRVSLIKNSYLKLFVKSNKWNAQNEQMEMFKMSNSELFKMSQPIHKNKKENK